MQSLRLQASTTGHLVQIAHIITQKNFNASPGNRIRFISTPTCNVSDAKGKIFLYKHNLFGKSEMPLTQDFNMGNEVRPYWLNANPGDYSSKISITNNYYSSGTRATVLFNDSWLENYWGDLW